MNAEELLLFLGRKLAAQRIGPLKRLQKLNMPKRRKHLKPEKQEYLKGFPRQMWRVVDGAILDAFKNHPEYLTDKGSRHQTARRSIAKRVTGSVLSYLEQSGWGRSGRKPSASEHDAGLL